MSSGIAVVLSGAGGKMGRVIGPAISAAPGLQLASCPGRHDDIRIALESNRGGVLVDFTVPGAARASALAAVAAGVAPVIGTTGLSDADVDDIAAAAAAAGIGGAVIPNFAAGAVLMIRFAEIAARHFDAVEIVEMHAATKRDAPSGTAIHTADRVAAARGDRRDRRATSESLLVAGARGGDVNGVGMHSIRIPGVVAEQQVILGAEGQTLTIGHRTTGRECYISGLLATIRAVAASQRFYRRLDDVLGLDASA